MSNGTDPQIEALAAGPQPFPNWPPNSGGYPVLTPELGPITNPFPYGSPQGANISTANPYPPGGIWKGTFYPAKMPPLNGQNQGGANQLPPMTKNWEAGPIKAPPSLSAISPTPIMGPGPQGTPPY